MALRIRAATLCLLLVLNGCGGGGTGSLFAPVTKAIASLNLSWSSATQALSSAVEALLGVPGSLTIEPSGTPPYSAVVAGTCALLASITSVSILVNVTTGICAIVVQDALGNVRALDVGGTLPRGFLEITPSGLADATETVHLALGASQALNVNETVVQSSVNAPYTASVAGSCLTVSSANSPADAAASFTLTATAPGQCVAIFADTAGQTTTLNVSVP